MSGHPSARIDAHQHFWRYDPIEYGWIDDSMPGLRRDFLPDDLACEMARAGVDASVAVQARQTLDETRWLLGLADEHQSIAGVVGWVDLQAPDARRHLELLRRHRKLVGVRHIAQSEPDDWFLVRPGFVRGVALLAEFDLAYDILVYRRQLPAAAELAGLLPEQRFVLDHLGKPDIRGRELEGWARQLRALARHENVYAKLSGLVTEAHWQQWTLADIRPYLDVAYDCFGPDRLMIGSDWPVCTLAADYQRTMNVIADYVSARPSHQREAVLGGNAAKFWKLPMPVPHA